MLTTRRRIADLSDAEHVLFRALCTELEALESDIAAESSEAKPDFCIISTAMRDRRLAVQWLRQLNFPPASHYSDGPDPEQESLILQEAVND